MSGQGDFEKIRTSEQGSAIRASVVVPAKNADDVIEACLDALTNQTAPLSDYEIILVDDGSTDETATKAEKYPVRLIRTESGGPAKARNLGAKHALGDVLLFTDADCIPRKDWVEKMLQPFEEPEVMGVKGAYESFQTEPVARFVQIEYQGKYDYMSKFPAIDFIDTYSAGFRKEVFLDLGGFDIGFPGASVEDQEFSFRMHALGHKMLFTPDAVVAHRHADNLRWYYRKKFRIGYWKVKVLKRHPDKMKHDTHTPPGLKLQIPVALMTPIAAAAIPLTGTAFFFFLCAVFIGLGSRETLNCLRWDSKALAAVSPVIMLFRSWGLGLGLLAGWMRL